MLQHDDHCISIKNFGAMKMPHSTSLRRISCACFTAAKPFLTILQHCSLAFCRHNPKLWLQPFLIVATTHDGGLLEVAQHSCFVPRSAKLKFVYVPLDGILLMAHKLKSVKGRRGWSFFWDSIQYIFRVHHLKPN